MLTSRIGEVAALGAAICWTITGLCFESAGKKVGSLAVNFITLVFALIFISMYTYFVRGYMFPVDASLHNWTFLSISGIIGFFLGDIFLFKAYVELGTRLSLLIMATSPPMTAILGYFFLKEDIALLGLLGMLITILGISIVILGRKAGEKKFKLNYSLKGIVFAFLGAIGQSIGTIFSKVGMGDYNPFAATQIRIIAGLITFIVLFIYLRKWDILKEALKDRATIAIIGLGSIFGAFLGVSLQLTSLQYTAAGITATITSITPVIIIPFSILIFKEKISAKEILGAIVSVGGVAVLFLI